MAVQPSTPEAIKFCNNAEKTMNYLYARWLDEKEYEDINDYRKPLEPIAQSCGVIITSMNKRPFGCTFTVAGKTFQLFANSKSYGYKRIG